MKIGYGKKRIVWYVVIGGAVGGVLALENLLLENAKPGTHNWIIAILIPILAGGMALLAWRENSLFKWGNRLDESRKRVNELMLSAVDNKKRSATFQQESLDTCWKRLDCDKEDCPAYGLEHSRCWLIAGTFCRGQVQGKFARKLKDCRLCEVYQSATTDPVNEITENFYAMNHMLGEREEQLELAYGEARMRSEKLAGLVSLTEAALSTVHLSEMMQNLLESAASFVGADFGLVFLSDAAGANLVAQASYGLPAGAEARLAPRVGEGLVGQAYAGRYIAVSEDLTTDSRETNILLKTINARTLISLPLQIRDQILGVLALGTFTSHHYTEEEKDSLLVAADRIAIAIENAQLAGKLGRDREQFELMAAVNRDLGSGGGISSVYESFMIHASSLIDFDQASLALWHSDTNEVEIVAMKTEAPRSWMGEGLKLPRDALPVGSVIESRRPLIREEISGDEYPTDKLLIQEGIRSAVYFPLISQGEVLGTVILGSFRDAAFTRDDVELLEPVTRQLGLVLDNARLLREAKGSSLIDSLTGLRNHRFFIEAVGREVARSARFNRPVSLLVIDIDGFKAFNEKYGHDAGDGALRKMARILSAEVREIDITARSGGDEFSILMPEVGVVNSSTEEADALHVAERIRGVVADESFAPDGALIITLSMGIAEFPAHTANAEELIERAGWAQREAKARGKNRVVMAPRLKTTGDINPAAEAGTDAGSARPDASNT